MKLPDPSRSLLTLAIPACSLAVSWFTPAARADDWNPPPPPADEFDWIQLSSGEWLKGELKGYVDDEVYFDSDKLGLQTLDREDVKFLRTASPVRVGYQRAAPDAATEVLDADRIQVAEGTVEVKNGKVRLRDSGETVAPVEDVVTIATGAESEWDNWSAKIAVGANYREGNTSQVDYDASLELARITPTNRFNFNYLGNYSRSEGVDFANNHRADFNLDLYRSPHFFIRPVFGEYFRDPFQNIAHRGLLGAGIGFEIVDNPKTTWELSMGPAYQFTEFDSVPTGASKREGSLAGVFSSRYETEISDHVDFVSLYRAVVTDEDAGLYFHHFANSLSFELTDDLDFDVSLIWDRIEKPSREATGLIPKQDDFRLMFLLGVEL